MALLSNLFGSIILNSFINKEHSKTEDKGKKKYKFHLRKDGITAPFTDQNWIPTFDQQ